LLAKTASVGTETFERNVRSREKFVPESEGPFDEHEKRIREIPRKENPRIPLDMGRDTNAGRAGCGGKSGRGGRGRGGRGRGANAGVVQVNVGQKLLNSNILQVFR